MWEIFYSFLFFTSVKVLATGNIQCMDENNNPVDWYYVYKLPQLHYAKEPSLREGKGYIFVTDSSIDNGWKFSSEDIDSSSTPIANTISFLNTEEKDKLFWAIYNDQGVFECDYCGHTKGIIAADKSGGFWLIHSIPHYLQFDYPATGLRYAQSALCISFNQKNLNLVGDLLKYNQPSFQKWNLNDEIKVLYPKIVKAIFNNGYILAPYKIQTSLVSKSGVLFEGFAKSQKFYADLYEWVAKSLGEDLYTETWINGPGVLPSECDSDYRVINVESIAYEKLGIKYTSHKDHSKLAISTSKSDPWVCVGDINRATSQEHRGGGTVCQRDSRLWLLYNSMINSTEGCSSQIKNSIF